MGFYVPEHLSCINCENGYRPAAEVYDFYEGEKIETNTTDAVILFLLEGKTLLTCGEIRNREMYKDDFMLFPAGINIVSSARENARMLILRIRKPVQMCDKYSLERLFADIDPSQVEHGHLRVNQKIEKYLDLFMECMGEGMRCVHYFDTKITELFFLLHGYYPKEQLASFFHLLISPDAIFTEFVWKHYRQAKNVIELAGMSKQGLTAFKRKFKKIYGIPPQQWMTEQKVRNIYHELTCSEKSIKQIAEDYHFASLSHLTTFCRKKIGIPPARIRNRRGQ